MDRWGEAVGTAGQGCEAKGLQARSKRSACASARNAAVAQQRKRLHDNARPDCRLHQPRPLS